MTAPKHTMRRLSDPERGATPIEFGLTVGLVATFLVVMVAHYGESLVGMFDAAGRAF